MGFTEYIYTELLSSKKHRESLKALLWSKGVIRFGLYKTCFGIAGSSHLPIDSNPGVNTMVQHHFQDVPVFCCTTLLIP